MLSFNRHTHLRSALANVSAWLQYTPPSLKTLSFPDASAQYLCRPWLVAGTANLAHLARCEVCTLVLQYFGYLLAGQVRQANRNERTLLVLHISLVPIWLRTRAAWFSKKCPHHPYF